jgi:hypothetical protein
MKKTIALAMLVALTGPVFAQLNPLPPSSATDGVLPQSKGVNAGPTHWDNPSTLGAYRFASNDNVPLFNASNVDSKLGLTWSSATPASVLSFRSAINAGGGTIRTIFTGETAGWLNDFGYTYSGQPQGPNSYTVWSDVQAVSPANINFGDYFDVSLAIGRAGNFDLWLNGTDSFSTINPTPTTNGGVYTAFNQGNSSPFAAPGNVRWATTPILVNTFLPAIGAYQDIATYLVSFEDWRIDRGSDRDYSDFVVGLQFYNANGQPFGPTPVPEPSTYGVIGAITLVGLILFRRLRKPASNL